MLQDPKAIHYIYQSAASQFVKHRERNLLLSTLLGEGLATVNGEYIHLFWNNL
jgi:hypothetical protein